jgi:hypothetical protein
MQLNDALPRQLLNLEKFRAVNITGNATALLLAVSLNKGSEPEEKS